MNEKQDKVIAWIKAGMDYNSGIGLLTEISTKQGLTNGFPGKEKTFANKLAYEIMKASSLGDVTNWKRIIQDIQSGNTPVVEIKNTFTPIIRQELPVSSDLPDSDEIVVSKPLFEYPLIIRRVINDYAELFQERSKLHTTMAEMPESNADSICIKRAELFDVIKSISARLEELYTAKSEFEQKGIIPDETELYPTMKKEYSDTNLLPDLSVEDLKKHKKNLQSSNSKDMAILDYQSKERKEVKTPMPAGPKRIKIEMRIADRKKQIQEIEMALLHT